MNNLTGQTIKSVLNNRYTLTESVSQGAQGVIYGENSGEFLIKILLEQNENVQLFLENKLKALYEIDFPTRFIKPLDILKFKIGNKSYVGYVMKRVKGHIVLNKLLIPSDNMTFGEWYNSYSGGLKRRLYLAYQIAQSFALLHNNNMAYCDISGNNILVATNPQVNSVCMVDIDNVYTPGTLGNNIVGTIRYIAPEVTEKKMKPDVVTDDYSLAVILFELLRCGHPYVGDFVKDGSPEVELAAYRGAFPYVDDENDNMNKATDILPEYIIFNDTLKKLFRKTFVDGRKNRMSRATAKELAVACLEASNALIRCSHCSAWYYPMKELKQSDGYFCPWCSEEAEKKVNSLKAYIKFGEIYPRFIDDTENLPDRIQYHKTFILQDGNNFITANYIRRALTLDDYVPKTTKYEVEGNLKINFVVSYNEADNHCEMVSLSDSVIYIQRKGIPLMKIEKGNHFKLKDGDTLYFELLPKKISFNDVMTGNCSATTRRMAIIRLG
jgi:serine/threonine protein kinase